MVAPCPRERKTDRERGGGGIIDLPMGLAVDKHSSSFGMETTSHKKRERERAAALAVSFGRTARGCGWNSKNSATRDSLTRRTSEMDSANWCLRGTHRSHNTKMPNAITNTPTQHEDALCHHRVRVAASMINVGDKVGSFLQPTSPSYVEPMALSHEKGWVGGSTHTFSVTSL